jgi:hypothetical protein
MIFMQTAGSAMAMSIPFSVYGESVIIMVQNFFILLLIWNYNKTISTPEKMAVFFFYIGYAYVLFVTPNIIQQYQWDLISSSNSVLSKSKHFLLNFPDSKLNIFIPSDIVAKLPTLINNFKMKSTGQMAFATFMLSFLGSAARLGTVLVESDDFMFKL